MSSADLADELAPDDRFDISNPAIDAQVRRVLPGCYSRDAEENGRHRISDPIMNERWPVHHELLVSVSTKDGSMRNTGTAQAAQE